MNTIKVSLSKKLVRGMLMGMLALLLLRTAGTGAVALALSCGQWNMVTSPTKGLNAELNSVAVASPNDVWAVGSYAFATQPLIEHWDGSSWTMVPSPPNPGFTDVLFGVAVSGSDLWAVGTYYDQPGATNQTLTEFYC